MSVEALSWALSADVTDPIAKLVLIGLANHADSDGRSAFPVQSTLAVYASCSDRSVRTKLAELEASGWISRGDQELVAHRPGNRRPVVWDLALRGRNVVPATPEAGTPVPPNDPQAGTGVPAITPVRGEPRSGLVVHRPERGGRQAGSCVPTEPSLTVLNPPTPQSSTTDQLGAPSRCRRHWPDIDPTCHRCRLDAGDQIAADRLANNRRRWEVDQSLRAADIARCRLCNEHGYRGPQLCDHDPTAADRARTHTATLRSLIRPTTTPTGRITTDSEET